MVVYLCTQSVLSSMGRVGSAVNLSLTICGDWSLSLTVWTRAAVLVPFGLSESGGPS